MVHGALIGCRILLSWTERVTLYSQIKPLWQKGIHIISSEPGEANLQPMGILKQGSPGDVGESCWEKESTYALDMTLGNLLRMSILVLPTTWQFNRHELSSY